MNTEDDARLILKEGKSLRDSGVGESWLLGQCFISFFHQGESTVQ